MQFFYHIEGMHCTTCVEKIKLALSSHFNIIEITLNPPMLTIEANDEPLISELNKHAALAGDYQLHRITDTLPTTDTSNETGLRAYYPIFLIAVYIVGVATINNFTLQTINWQGWMNQFMAGFFLVFSAFKFLDLRGFAEGYSTYDLLAKRFFVYGYVYPFLELSLGILYLTGMFPTFTQIATIIIMGFSSIGVIKSLLKKQKFQCACLGTIIKVPLSSVTLIEDLTMVVLAASSLMMGF